MKINLSKTRIIVFRNGGFLWENEMKDGILKERKLRLFLRISTWG